MTKLPFLIAVERAERSQDWRFIMHHDGWDCKLSPDQASELASSLEEAKTGRREAVVSNHEGIEITVWGARANKIALDFRSPHPDHATVGTGDGLTMAQVGQLRSELLAFVEQASGSV